MPLYSSKGSSVWRFERNVGKKHLGQLVIYCLGKQKVVKNFQVIMESNGG